MSFYIIPLDYRLNLGFYGRGDLKLYVLEGYGSIDICSLVG